MSKKALVILAEGAEEMEVVIVVDTLRRASVGNYWLLFVCIFYINCCHWIMKRSMSSSAG